MTNRGSVKIGVKYTTRQQILQIINALILNKLCSQNAVAQEKHEKRIEADKITSNLRGWRNAVGTLVCSRKYSPLRARVHREN